MNNKNLKSLADRPQAERREIAKAGGKASGKARAERRRLCDELRALLSEQTEGGELVQTALLRRLIEGLRGGGLATGDLVKIAELLGETDRTERVELEAHTAQGAEDKKIIIDYSTWYTPNLEYMATKGLFDPEEAIDLLRRADKDFKPSNIRHEKEEASYSEKLKSWEELHRQASNE